MTVTISMFLVGLKNTDPTTWAGQQKFTAVDISNRLQAPHFVQHKNLIMQTRNVSRTACTEPTF